MNIVITSLGYDIMRDVNVTVSAIKSNYYRQRSEIVCNTPFRYLENVGLSSLNFNLITRGGRYGGNEMTSIEKS